MPRRLASSTSACAEAAHLGHRAGRAVDRVEPHGLDRIDHRDLGRVGPLERRHDVAHRGGGGELHRRVAEPQPLGAQPHLVDRLLARDVGAGGVLLGERRRDLQQQRRLADAGIAADQQRRADHQAAAADAVELDDAALVARRLRRRAGEAGELERAALAAARQPAAGRAGRGRRFLGDGVPFAAALAAAAPLGRDGAARLADEALERPGHSVQLALAEAPAVAVQPARLVPVVRVAAQRLHLRPGPTGSLSARASAAASPSSRAPTQWKKPTRPAERAAKPAPAGRRAA